MAPKKRHRVGKDKKYRQKLKEDPVRYAEYLRKERERNRKNKQSITVMTEREARNQKKRWKKYSRDYRVRQKHQALVDSYAKQNSPPLTPEAVLEERPRAGSAELGRKKVRRDRAKAYKTIKKLEKQLAEKRTVCERYKKQAWRLKVKMRVENSPIARTNKVIGNEKVSGNVRRTLIKQFSLISGIKRVVLHARKQREKQILNKLLINPIIEKYRLKSHVCKTFNVYWRKKDNCSSDNPFVYTRKVRKDHYGQKMVNLVREFMERDDNSKILPGKRDTVTRNKIKKQRRLMLDSLKNLHLKFLAENPFMCISYSLFCKLNPFWVQRPTLKDRETCACKTHENLQFKADALHRIGALTTNNLDTISSWLCCDIKNIKCMYRECDVCKNQTIHVNADINENTMIKWNSWKSQREERQKIGRNGEKHPITVQVTKKEVEETSVNTLITKFQADMTNSLRHFYNIFHQYSTLRELKRSLMSNEVVIHCDFSENYGCKSFREIQSCHFGASHNQVTLHTGVMYSKENGVQSFCTISDSMRHDPCAIWGHLMPILHQIKQATPNIDTIHFISDGPTTQYRCKTNFALFSKLIYSNGFVKGSWNFMEASHGKGAADGTGGAIKRTADNLVAHGKDITNAQELQSCLSQTDSHVKLFLIKENDIACIDREVPSNTRAVPGTMRVHQLTTEKFGEVAFRMVSCFCGKNNPCTCYSPVKHVLITAEKSGDGVAADGSVGVQASGSVGVEAGGSVGVEADGSVGVQASGSVGVKTDGSVGVEASGSVGVEADGSVGVQASGSVGVEASGSVGVEAYGSVGVEADGSVGVEAGGSVGVQASGSVGVEADGSVGVEAGGSDDRDVEKRAKLKTPIKSKKITVKKIATNSKRVGKNRLKGIKGKGVGKGKGKALARKLYDDCECLSCAELYSVSSGDWIQCQLCEKWAHAECADVPKTQAQFTCDICL